MTDAIGIVDDFVPSSTGTAVYQDMSIPTGVDVVGAMVLVCGDFSGPDDANTADWGTSGANYSMTFVEKVGSNATSSITYARAMDNIGFPYRKQNFRQTPVITAASASAPLVRFWANGAGSTPVLNIEGDFDSWLTKGIVIDWTDVTAVASLGESLRLTVVLFAGMTNFSVAASAPGAEGFNPDAWLTMHSFNGGSPGNDFTWGFGAASRVSSTITQASATCNWPRKTGTSEASEAFGLVRDDAYTCGVNASGVEQTAISISSSSGAGWVEAGSSTIDRAWAAMEFSDPTRVAAVAVEELDGSTGATTFDELGVPPELVIGYVIPATSTNSVIGDASSQSTASMFVIKGTEAYSVMTAQAHGLAAEEAQTFSGRDRDGISVLEHDGSGVRFQVSSVTLTETGFSGMVDVGMTGRMVLFAISMGEIIEESAEEVHVDDGVLISITGEDSLQISPDTLDIVEEVLTTVTMQGDMALDLAGRINRGGGEAGYIAGVSQEAPGRISRGGGEAGHVGSDGVSGE